MATVVKNTGKMNEDLSWDFMGCKTLSKNIWTRAKGNNNHMKMLLQFMVKVRTS